MTYKQIRAKKLRLHRRALDLFERVSYIRWNISRVNLTPIEKRRISLSLKRCGAISKELWLMHGGLK